jgi:hypothetical protein
MTCAAAYSYAHRAASRSGGGCARLRIEGGPRGTVPWPKGSEASTPLLVNGAAPGPPSRTTQANWLTRQDARDGGSVAGRVPGVTGLSAPHAVPTRAGRKHTAPPGPFGRGDAACTVVRRGDIRSGRIDIGAPVLMASGRGGCCCC